MAKRLQHRGGTTSQHSSFTGAVREVTVDTDKNTLVVHDGATAGGHPLATATNFTSTGIDDNATSKAITINSLQHVELHGGQIESNNNTSSVTYSGGSNSNAGANLTLFGGSHATTPNLARFRSSATEVMRITSSGKVGIGTTAPVGGLEVNNSSGIKITRHGYSQNMQLYPANNNVPTILGVGGNGIHIGTTTTTGIHIDGSDNVGIGTNSPTLASGNGVVISGGSSVARLELRNTTSGTTSSDGAFLSYSANDLFLGNRESGNSIFYTNNAERMRIDSSGNLLVGKTAIALATVGGELRENGQITGTRDGNASLILNRLNSDGEIAKFYKDGTVVGNIGAGGGYLHIGKGDTGIGFASDDIIPYNTDTPATRDNGIDLGGSGYRFKDLYLGGGLYVGGTGSANKLDDYEEGTWTPSIQAGGNHYSSVTHTTQNGRYTKVGRLVTAHFRVAISAVTIGSASGNIQVEGLPFTCSSADSTNQAGTIAYVSGINFGLSSFDCVNVGIVTKQNENKTSLSKTRLNGTADGCHNSSIGQTTDIQGTAIYFVD